MVTLVLAAGDGARFKNYSNIPKPFITVNGKEIIKRTTDSIHKNNSNYDNWFFSIRTSHNIESKLKSIYSNDINVINFDYLTRGNLETAYISTSKISDKSQKLLILDSDNEYDGSGLLEKFSSINIGIGICHFDPLDDSYKWGFSFSDQRGNVSEIREKDPAALNDGGKPMIGTFFFSSIELFELLAKNVLKNQAPEKNEYYMTQCIKQALKDGVSVISYKVENVIPLGTPEDVDNFIFRDKNKK